MRGRHEIGFDQLKKETEWQTISNTVARLDDNPELDLGDDEIQT